LVVEARKPLEQQGWLAGSAKVPKEARYEHAVDQQYKLSVGRQLPLLRQQFNMPISLV